MDCVGLDYTLEKIKELKNIKEQLIKKRFNLIERINDLNLILKDINIDIDILQDMIRNKALLQLETINITNNILNVNNKIDELKNEFIKDNEFLH